MGGGMAENDMRLLLPAITAQAFNTFPVRFRGCFVDLPYISPFRVWFGDISFLGLRRRPLCLTADRTWL
jgi:hypothetical protein